MANNDYLRPAEAFLAWFKAFPGTTFHSDIEIVDLRARGAGRGIIAKADIAPDTVLFTIPRQAILGSATSELARLVPSIVQGAEEEGAEGDDGEADDDDGDSKTQDPWTSLILVMIYEFLRGPQSPWQPYFGVLPAVFDTPMFWAPDDLAALQASPIVGRVGRAEADAMIRTKVLPVVRAHSDIFFGEGTPLDDDALLQLGHRMGSTIMAYSFSLEKDEEEDDDHEEDEDEHMHGPECNHGHDDSDEDSVDGWTEDKDDQLPLGMVPMADMLNADAEFNAHINHGVDTLTATAVCPIKAGEEILNYYGPLSNGELLRRYGYTTEKHAFFDAVDLPWPLVQEHLAGQLGLSSSDAEKVAQKLDLDEFEDPIMLDRDFEEDEADGHLTAPPSGHVLSELPPQLRRQARAFAKAARKWQQKAKGPPKASAAAKSDKEAVATAIAAAVAARLAAYDTTLEADEAELAALGAATHNGQDNVAAGRLYSALRVRIGEKRLLKEALALAEAAVAGVSEADGQADGQNGQNGKNGRRDDGDVQQPSGKRQKTRA